MNKPDSRMLLILVMMIAITLLHYLTGVDQHPLHALYRKLYYIPILFSAIFFRFYGSITVSILVVVMYFPHVHWQWGGHFFHQNADKTLEIVSYLFIGPMVGWYSSYQFRLKNKLKEMIDEVQEKTRTLIEIRESVEKSKRLEALGLLGAGISHEIKNPLASIQGILELISDEGISQVQRSELRRLGMSEVERINRIVLGFLDMSKQSDEACDIRLSEFMHDFVNLMQPQFRSYKKNIHLEMENENFVLCVNRGALQQILLNLVLNALDFASTQVIVRVFSKENEIFFDVEDDGDGVPQAIRERIFEIFYTTRSSGTGLGLSISSNLAREISAEILLFSPQNPTVFRLRLPMTKADHGKHSFG